MRTADCHSSCLFGSQSCRPPVNVFVVSVDGTKMGCNDGIQFYNPPKVYANGPLSRVLSGNYPHNVVRRMNTLHLESLVTRLVKCTSKPTTSGSCTKDVSYRRPKWWPKKLSFTQPINQLRVKNGNRSSWHKILAQLVEICSHFHNGMGTVVSTSNVAGQKRLRSVSNENVYHRAKRQKLEPPTKDVLCEILPHNVSPVPVVRLFDILKPPVKAKVTPTKAEFMGMFGLVATSAHHDSLQIHSKVGYVRLTALPQVPVSSNYGRVLLKQEPQTSVCNDFYIARKRERVEWYVQTKEASPAPSLTEATYPVTYCGNKDRNKCHTYKYPKRQSYQVNNGSYTVDFLKTLCKPVCVKLERLRLKDSKPNKRRRKPVLKEVRVVIRRMRCAKLKRKMFDKQPVVLLKRLKL